MNFQYLTDRLVLRIEQEQAADKVLAFYKKNKPYFDAFELTRPDHFYTKAFHQATLKVEYQELLRKHIIRFYVYEKEVYLHDASTAPIIGSVSISNIRMGGFKSGMLGYKFDHDHWGKGYAKEALDQLISIAFYDLSLHRLEAYIMPNNVRSIHLIKALSFSYEGCDRKSIEVNTRFEDHERYARIKTELL